MGDKLDLVNDPPHYTEGEIECKDGIREALRGCKDGYTAFCLGNVIKYIWRFRLKGNPVQDLKKGAFYLNEAIKHQEKIYENYGNVKKKE